MKSQKIIGAVLGFTLIIAIPMGLVFAQQIIVAQDVTIYLPGIGRYFTLLSTSNALDQFQINSAGTTFTVTTNLSTGAVRIKSTEGVNIGGLNNTSNIALTSCDSNGALLVIPANISSASTVTVTPPATICGAASVIGAGTTGGSSGGSGGPGSLSTVGVVTVPPVQTTAVGTPTPPLVTPGTTTPVEVKLEFTDLGKLKEEDRANILQIVQLMLEKKTYEMPENQKFRPTLITKGVVALWMANAISGIGCGSATEFTNNKACYEKALEKGLVTKKFKRLRRLTRIEAYELFWKARNIALKLDVEAPLEEASVSQLEAVCKDIENPTQRMAQIYFTAKKLGIISEFKDKSCFLKKPMPRVEAVRFATRTLGSLKK